MSFNKIAIYGYLGRDPELSYSKSDVAVCKVAVATTEKRKDADGEYVDHTTWFRCTAFGRTAELINEHFKKGSPIYLEGKLRLENYTDREGNARTSPEVTVSGFEFVGRAQESNGGGQQSQQSQRAQNQAAQNAQAPTQRQQQQRSQQQQSRRQAQQDTYEEDPDIPF